MIICSAFLEFSAGKDFGFKILSEILFSIISPIASAVLWTTLLKAVLRASSPVSVAVSNNCFPYLLERFVGNDKNPYLLTLFSCSWLCRITPYFYLLTSNVKLTLSSIPDGLPFCSVNIMIISLTLNCLVQHLAERHKIYWL